MKFLENSTGTQERKSKMEKEYISIILKIVTIVSIPESYLETTCN